MLFKLYLKCYVYFALISSFKSQESQGAESCLEIIALEILRKKDTQTVWNLHNFVEGKFEVQ